MLLVAAALTLQLELVRHSLTGTHYRYGQYLDGQRIVAAELEVTVRPDGTREEISSVATRFSAPARGLNPASTLVNVNGVATHARRVVEGRTVTYVNETGEVIRKEPRFAGAKTARVFLANPVKTLNDPTLRDQNNSAIAVPDAAYTTVDLDDVNASGPLGGPYVQITDAEPPNTAPADASQPLVFDRSQTGFEDVNAYFHIDRSQKYLQSLGYTGVRALVPYAVPVDTHARGGADDSIFIPTATVGQGMILFGDGGTDDAEDPDLVVHEYAHAVHEWISPGAYLGPFASEGRAISEGFADYWGFSASYAIALGSGRDPFCFADWDARCAGDSASEQCGYPAGADCLRRLDSANTMADFDRNEAPGTEYLNGVIWSSALREIFVVLTQRYGIESGKRIADTIAVESLFGAPPSPTFAGVARNMIAADRDLNGGANADVICAAMTRRGILSDCVTVPRSELTLVQSVERGVPIPDNDPNGVTLTTIVSDTRAIEHLNVRVDIDHPFRGDLQIVLIAPDGTQFVLQNPSSDRSRDVRATYGRDAAPVDSLDALRGRPANGTWRLRVADLRLRDTGTVLSWGLLIQYAGEAPAATRPTSATRQVVPVAGRIPGALGTFFTTDVRLLNRGTRDTTATLIFTPSGSDGRTDFAAINIDVAAGQVVALNDVVGGFFSTEGIGQLEIDGDVVAATRTYTRVNGGTTGEAIPPVPASGSTTSYVARLLNTKEFRSNIGVAEVSGGSGTIEIDFIDAASGAVIAKPSYAILPFGHLQWSATAGTAMVAAVHVISGGARIVAYGSVIDNASGDATYVAGESGGTNAVVVAPAIGASGANGTQWTTDLWVTRLSPPAAPITVTYTDRATLAAASLTVNVSTNVHFPDVVRFAFHMLGTAGVLMTTLDANEIGSAVIATGHFAQSVPLMRLASQAGLDIPFVESSGAFRTNVGLISLDGSTVVVELRDASGRVVETSTHFVRPNVLDQFTIASRVTNGRVHLTVSGAPIAAYASVVDNVTGDASFVPAR